MKLIFYFLGMANWWWTNNSYLAGFFAEFIRACAILEYGDLMNSKSDGERQFGVFHFIWEPPWLH